MPRCDEKWETASCLAVTRSVIARERQRLWQSACKSFGKLMPSMTISRARGGEMLGWQGDRFVPRGDTVRHCEPPL